MAPSTSSQPMYQKDERVLCFHHELLYEAKVLDHKLKDPNDKKDGYSYRVHYKGWKNTPYSSPPKRSSAAMSARRSFDQIQHPTFVTR
ncbi:hypothetical protein KC355_g15012 [Hortaea werneckii]|nr:hypothetical protein KC355_g15012 [Hortaea werneckii]